MKLSSRGRYAVMALADLACEERGGCCSPVSIADIANRQRLPVAYLEQLFAQLRRAGVVASTRGAAGGYRLAKGAAGTRIADIVAAVDENLQATRCAEGGTGCLGGERCLTHDLWDALGDCIHGFLCSITLDDVIQGRVKPARVEKARVEA